MCKKVTIKCNEYDEYELPTEPNSKAIYYTDDKQDAIDTAKLVHGANVKLVFRRGTYGVQVDPELDLNWS